MKKFLMLLVVLALICVLPLQAFAAGSASVSGPDVVRAGDTITVSFRAGGGIYGGSGSVSFDSNQLTLQGYAASVGSPWVVEFAGNNFVFYDNSMSSPLNSSTTIFKATFKVSASVKPGTEIKVSFTGVKVSDGTADTNIGTKTYSKTIAEPLSNNANLKSLTVSNAEISPAFSAGTTNYTASVPYSTSKLEVKAVAEHGGAAVTVANTALKAGGTTDVTVTVKAEDGTTKVYHIKTKRAQDPNYVPSKVNTLESLAVTDFKISPAFTQEKTAYAVYLPYETDHLDISAQVTDTKAELAIPELSNIPVGETTYDFVVTAENGDTLTYTLTVFRADVFDPTAEPTEPTEPETEPTTEPATEPTTVPTEVPTEAPATETPTEAPAEEPEKQGPSFGVDFWLWILIVIMAFCAGCITILLIPKARREA